MSNVAAAVPNKLRSLRDLLEKSKGQIALCLPKHLSPERMTRVALTAVQKTPELLDCDPVSVVGAVMQASQLGLDLDGVLGQAYLVPFFNTKARRKDCQLIVGYKGFIALAHRTGEVRCFHGQVVCENDEFSYAYGSHGFLRHVPSLKARGEPTAAYAFIELRNGGSDYEVIGWPEILSCQQKYARKGKDGSLYGPWVDYLPEMARKTPIRRLAKRLPLSVELARAVALDDLADAGLPQDLGDELGLPRADETAARLGALAAAVGGGSKASPTGSDEPPRS